MSVEASRQQRAVTIHSRRGIQGQWLRRVSIAGLLLFFVVTAGSSIRTPGLQYDEMLFVNAALGTVDDSFVHRRILGVPVMLMPYIGALKSYIYGPIFRLWGTSPATIRWPAIAISAVSLLLAYAIAQCLLPPGTALWVLALVATDPAFIFHTKLDYGPIVLATFFRLLTVLAFVLFVRRGSFWFAALAIAALAMGLFDKSNFVWFVNALLVAGIVAFRKDLVAIARRHPRRSAAAIAGLLAVLLGFLLFSIAPLLSSIGYGNTFELTGGRLQRMTMLVKRGLSSEYLRDLTMEHPRMAGSWAPFGFAVAMGILLLKFARTRSEWTAGIFFALLFLVTFVQFVVTRETHGAHHAISLWPWHHYLIVLAASVLAANHNATRRRPLRVWMTSFLVILIVASQVHTTLAFVTAHRAGHGFRVAWDPAIYRLSEELERRHATATRVLSTDWGMHTQLQGLAARSRRARYRDVWIPFRHLHLAPADVRASLRDKVVEAGALIVAHSAAATEFEETRRNLLNLVRSERLRIHRLAVIENVDGKPIYEIYRFESAGNAR